MCEDNGPPRATVSASMKVNLGNYSSAEAFVSVQGVRAETTAEEVEALMETTGKIAWTALKAKLMAKIADLEEEFQRTEYPKRR